MKVAPLFVGLCLCSVSAFAQHAANDGNALLRQCTPAQKLMDGQAVSDNELIDAEYCMGYVRATLDVYATWEGADMTLHRKSADRPCLPYDKPILTGQGVKLVVKYLTEHPEKLHLINAVLIGAAFRESFRCEETASVSTR